MLPIKPAATKAPAAITARDTITPHHHGPDAITPRGRAYFLITLRKPSTTPAPGPRDHPRPEGPEIVHQGPTRLRSHKWPFMLTRSETPPGHHQRRARRPCITQATSSHGQDPRPIMSTRSPGTPTDQHSPAAMDEATAADTIRAQDINQDINQDATNAAGTRAA